MILFFKKHRLSLWSIDQVWGRGTRRTASVNQGSSCRYPSHNEGAHRHGRPGPCLAPLTECCGRVWWCTPLCFDSPATFYAASVFFSLEAHQSYILFSLHSFSFTLTILIFLSKHKIVKIKEFQLKYLKFLEFKNSQNFKFPHPNKLLEFGQ